jgi:hypothetical protein
MLDSTKAFQQRQKADARKITVTRPANPVTLDTGMAVAAWMRARCGICKKHLAKSCINERNKVQ